MHDLSKLMDKIINVFLGVSLTVIVIFVFSNVIFRYIFNSGIMWAPELSRYIFIWMTFIGAIAVLKSNQHLAVNMVVKRFPENLKKHVIILGNLIILGILYFVIVGSWKMTIINKNSSSPATGLPLSFIYISGLVLGISMGLIILLNTYKLLTNKASADDLVPPHRR